MRKRGFALLLALVLALSLTACADGRLTFTFKNGSTFQG